MIITVKHTISDSSQFWSRAQESLPNLPEGIKIHSVMPDESMSNAICVWEANVEKQASIFLFWQNISFQLKKLICKFSSQ
jgi:hypothetical protein